MVDQQRWKQAQEYEAAFWNSAAREGRDLSWYEWRAGRLRDELESLGLNGLTGGACSVLEVGSGPVGLAAFFPARRRVAVDPLARHYARRPELSRQQDEATHYLGGVGERLPFPDGAFDLVVIENCIDHVRDVDMVMSEIVRVLARSGVLYLTVNCRSHWGAVVHRVLASLVLDPGHPHSFTVARLRRLVTDHGFDLLDLRSGSLAEATREDLASGEPKKVAKAVLGVSFATASVIARRVGDP